MVDKDNYLLPLSRYIHLNPIKAKLSSGLEYRYSSLRFFLDAKAPEYLKIKFLLDFFPSKQKFIEYVKEGLSDNVPMPKPSGGVILGGEDFVKSLREKISKSPMDNVAFKNSLLSFSPRELEPLIQNQSKPFQIYCLRMLCKIPQKEIGRRFNLSFSAISKSVQRFEVSIKENKSLRKQFEEIQRRVSSFKN